MGGERDRDMEAVKISGMQNEFALLQLATSNDSFLRDCPQFRAFLADDQPICRLPRGHRRVGCNVNAIFYAETMAVDGKSLELFALAGQCHRPVTARLEISQREDDEVSSGIN